MKTPLLEVKNLKKEFHKPKGFLGFKKESVIAVQDVSFSIEEGEVVAIVGESGSGKSTTALSAIRLIEPTSGSSTFMGLDLLSMKPSELRMMRQKMQVVFQDPNLQLNPRKTILENIGEALLYHRLVQNEEEKRERVSEILKKVGLDPKNALFMYPHQFSGGGKQRIAIARALALNPKLIILDEAVSALDLANQAKILNLLLDLKEKFGLTYLFISHDLSIVRHFSDKLLVMYQGKIVESGPTQAIFQAPQHPYTKLLLSSLLTRGKETRDRSLEKSEK